MADKPDPHALPETFTIDQLEASGMFEAAEIEALKAQGDDLFTAEAPEQDAEDANEGADDDLAAAEAAAAAAKTPAPQPEDDNLALADVPDTTAAEAKVAEIKAARANLARLYDEGELTRAEMDAEMDKLIDQQAAAVAAIRQAEEVIQQNQQTAEQKWMSTLEAFKAQGNAHLFSDEHRGGFDKALRAVTGDPDNAGLPYATMISMAAQQHAVAYQARTGKAVEIKTARGNPIPGTGEQRRGPRPDPRPDPIDTLSGLNAPGSEMVQDGAHASLDRLASRDPLRAEELMARMRPDEIDAYLGLA